MARNPELWIPDSEPNSQYEFSSSQDAFDFFYDKYDHPDYDSYYDMEQF